MITGILTYLMLLYSGNDDGVTTLYLRLLGISHLHLQIFGKMIAGLHKETSLRRSAMLILLTSYIAHSVIDVKLYWNGTCLWILTTSHFLCWASIRDEETQTAFLMPFTWASQHADGTSNFAQSNQSIHMHNRWQFWYVIKWIVNLTDRGYVNVFWHPILVWFIFTDKNKQANDAGFDPSDLHSVRVPYMATRNIIQTSHVYLPTLDKHVHRVLTWPTITHARTRTHAHI